MGLVDLPDSMKLKPQPLPPEDAETDEEEELEEDKDELFDCEVICLNCGFEYTEEVDKGDDLADYSCSRCGDSALIPKIFLPNLRINKEI